MDYESSARLEKGLRSTQAANDDLDLASSSTLSDILETEVTRNSRLENNESSSHISTILSNFAPVRWLSARHMDVTMGNLSGLGSHQICEEHAHTGSSPSVLTCNSPMWPPASKRGRSREMGALEGQSLFPPCIIYARCGSRWLGKWRQAIEGSKTLDNFVQSADQSAVGERDRKRETSHRYG
ncbi:hypothetical protein M433DRAFT_132529 [Acidomyces richmondensis BFW]|nr:hypothetical protein M433DRAFT_132529 [Acidomyces richmondensis BFW]